MKPSSTSPKRSAKRDNGNPTGSDRYDVIFIGSGIGTMTAAAILARLHNKKVLVLERHYVLGGLTHTFRRPGNNEWDVGVHYIGDMNEGATMRRISDFISQGALKWNRMPDPFDLFSYPDFSFGQVGDKKRFISDLKSQFPAEAEGIDGYFADLRTAKRWHYWRLIREVLPGLLKPLAHWQMQKDEPLALSTVSQVLDRHFKDEKLKALVTSQWGDYGLPPSKAAFATHALVANHYLHGGYYPEGGAGRMAETIIPPIEARGGRFLINHEVKEILVENGRAVGVHVLAKKGKSGGELKRFYAPAVVSCAGAYLTYSKLLPPELGAPQARDLEDLVPSISTATIYIALKEDPVALGFKGENHWIFSGYDHDGYVASAQNAATEKAKGCYLSFPSLKTSDSQNHTAELIGFVDWRVFEQWRGTPWMKRGEDYEAAKEKLAENLFALVEERHPGFRDLVAYYEVSTPLSTEHFTGAPKGAIYGVMGTPGRYKKKSLGVRTPVKGLYLTGADAYALGVGGAMIGGVATAGVLSGPFGFFRNWRKILGPR